MEGLKDQEKVQVLEDWFKTEEEREISALK